MAFTDKLIKPEAGRAFKGALAIDLMKYFRVPRSQGFKAFHNGCLGPQVLNLGRVPESPGGFKKNTDTPETWI